MEQPTVRRKKTFPVRLTRFELLHLRDLFSVLLASDTSQTVSQALAAVEDRRLVEARLWQKLASTCREADLPTDDEAPDFVVAASQAPPVGVFKLAEEPAGSQSDEDDEKHESAFDEEESE